MTQNIKKVYLLTKYVRDFKNGIFDVVDPMGVNGYPYLKEFLRQKGFELLTIDFFDFKNPDPEAILLVINDPDEGIVRKMYHKLKYIIDGKYYGAGEFITNYRKYLEYFNRKILFQGECPAIEPRVFKKIKEFDKIYSNIYLTISDAKHKHFFLPLVSTPHKVPILEFNNRDRKRLVMINSNKSAFGRKNELYSERLRAIKYFSNRGLDLYGYGWNHVPAIPYILFSKYIKQAYRGAAGNKISVFSKYKFAICFDNARFAGYVTEKIFDCLFAGTIPIFYGAPDIEKYVPKECFIDFRSFGSYEKLDKYLNGMSQEKIDSYRSAAFQYISNSPKLQLFSENHFAETIYKAILDATKQN